MTTIKDRIYAHRIAKRIHEIMVRIDALSATNLDNVCEREPLVMQGDAIIASIPENLRDMVNAEWRRLYA